MSTDQEKALRDLLVLTLSGKQSHIAFADAFDGLTVEHAGAKPVGAPHTLWQLLEHLRIAQHDILEFSRDAHYKSPQWPEEYWPKTVAPPDATAWKSSLATFKRQAKEMDELISSGDLFKPIEGGDGQTLLREALVLASHNSYHLGQIVYLKKILLPEAA